jgi:putative redox protein
MTSKITYLGELRTECTHIKSGQTFFTDAPVDNHGKGAAFSPTDLMATSLGSCMVTIMGLSANNHHIDIIGTHLEITKNMASDPRRVSGIEIKLIMPKKDYSTKEKKLLEAAARSCPVALSLHPDLDQQLHFVWQDEA